MRKKYIWLAVIIITAAALVFVISSRISLYPEVIFGGTDSVFVKTDELEDTKTEEEELETDIDDHDELDFPNIDINAWCYVLINKTHLVKDYTADVLEYPDADLSFSADAYYQLAGLINAAKEAGFDPYISNGYISYTAQQKLYNEKASEIAKEQGCSFTEAQKLAQKQVALPGTSDHQTGLGIDITDKQYKVNDYSKMDKDFFEWLDEHCAEYGFIKRYPSDKSSITGYDEPWHYRFVGATAAKFIMENGLCFEEFVEHYDYQK